MLQIKHKETEFGIGDIVAVHQKLADRIQIFEGQVIAIKGRDSGRSFTVRRIGSQKVGIERIFPLASDVVEKVEVKRKGTAGVAHAKLYYTRTKPKKEIEKIFSRTARRTKK
jgi:large subunit ribosomal protein L19